MNIQQNQGKWHNYQIEKQLALAKTLPQWKGGEDAALKKVCIEFEAIFLNQIFKEMRKSVKMGSSSLIDGGFAEEVFKDMLFDEYSKISAENNSIGLAKMVYDTVMQQQSQGVWQ